MLPNIGRIRGLLFSALATSFLASYSEGFNDCLEEMVLGELQPADRCTADAEGALSLYGCDIFDTDHVELAACLSVSPSTIIKLDLGENSLTSVPEGLFLEMINLRELSFYENRLITTFPLGAFAGLKWLKHLDLGWMGLVSLPAGLFNDTRKLQTIVLEEQNFGFTELPDGLFDGLYRLRRLGLNANSLTTLPANIFSSVPRLSLLNLGENPITFLPATIFHGLGRIHEINLGFQLLTELPAGMFDGLKKLKRLKVTGNLLTTLPEGLFADTWRLKEISLGRNMLEELPEDTFLDLPSLITLDISANPDLQCKYEVDANASPSNIEWPEHLDGISAGDCLP